MLPGEGVQQPEAHPDETQVHAQPLLLAKRDALDNAGLSQVYAYNPFASISLHPVWVGVQQLLEGAFDRAYSSGCWAMLQQVKTARSVICGNNEIQQPVSWIPWSLGRGGLLAFLSVAEWTAQPLCNDLFSLHL